MSKEHSGEASVSVPSDVEGVTEIKTKKRLKGKWIALTVILTILILTGGAYVGIGSYFRTHFLPNTIVGGYECSGMNTAQAAEFWSTLLDDYVLEVTGREPSTGESGVVLGTITPEQIQMRYPDMTDTLEDIISGQEWLLWIMAYLGRGQEILFERCYYIYDDALVEDLVQSWNACQSGNMHTAQDAYISEYSESLRGYEVIPEIRGT